MRYSHYKPTGIAWLPEVPEGWEMVRNKTFLTITDEKVGGRKNEFTLLSLTKQGVIVRDLTEMKGKFPKDYDTYLVVRPGNLVFCLFDVDETPRTVGLVRNVGMLTGAYTNFQVDACRVLPAYACYYYLQVDDAKKLRPYYTGLRKVVKTNTFLQLRFPCPPMREQRAIVAFLDEKCGKVNRLVAAKEKEVTLLKELKQSMIAEAVTRGVHANRRLAPSGIPWLPEVPEGWEYGKVRQYFRLRATKVSEKEYPPLSVAKVGVVPQLSDVAISMAEGETRKLVKEGDYVVNSRSDRKGSCGIAPRDGSVTTISIVLEPHDIERKYVHYLFRSTPWVEEFYRNGRGIVADLWTTNFNQMRNMMLPVPPLAEQREIVEHIETRASKIDAAVAGLEKEIAALKEYKQRLIADVVTGQRRVA